MIIGVDFIGDLKFFYIFVNLMINLIVGLMFVIF